MRVLTITNMYPSPERPAWGTFVKSQMDSITNEGVHVDLLIIFGGRTKIAYFFAIFRMWARLFTRRYDVIHAHYGLCGLVAYLQPITPVVVSFCGDDLYGHMDKSGKTTKSSLFWVYLHKKLAKRVEAVIVKSPAMSELISEVENFVVPNGVNQNIFKPLDKNQCRKQLGLDQSKTYILFPYERTNSRKNYTELKKAIDALNQDRNDPIVLLDIFGVSNEEIAVYLNAVDLVAVPSFWEGSPNIVKEAMSCGTKILATDVGDVKQLIGRTLGCRLCTTDALNIASNIADMLALPHKTAGHEQISHLSIENVARKVIGSYALAVERRPKWTAPHG